MSSNFEKGKDREEKIDKFLDNLAWFHSDKSTPSGLYSKIGKIEERIDELNGKLTEAGKSSDRLTQALNRITLAGVIVASLSLLVTIAVIVLQIVGIIK